MGNLPSSLFCCFGIRRNSRSSKAKKNSEEPPELPNFSDIPYNEQYYFLDFLLTTIEECVADYAQSNLREQLESYNWRSRYLRGWMQLKHSWMMPGRTELTDWTVLLRSIRLPGVRETDQWLISSVLYRVEDLRHTTIHRRPLSAEKVLLAMKLPGILEDAERA